MEDWNVVVTANAGGFKKTCELLQPLGDVKASLFFNVLTMHVDDPEQFIAQVERQLAAQPEMQDPVARIMPVTHSFVFQSPEAFEEKAAAIVEPWLDRIAGSTFHVRMHRRGFQGRLASPVEERFLDHYIIGRLQQRGADATVSFDDPDFIIAVETVGQRAGLSLWAREDLQRHPLLKLN
jgi:tRNA(Ser,Leu) C12 N-acetylase TAN1